MTQIIIEPQNPLKFLPEGLTPLAEVLSELVPDYEVRVALSDEAWDRRIGYIWWDIIWIWVPWQHLMEVAALAAVKQLSEETIKWLWQKRKSPAPKCVEIYGPDGRVLKAVRSDKYGDVLIDMTSSVESNPKRSPPSTH